MPYFVYKIFDKKKLEFVNSFGKYREAKDLSRSMRAELKEEDDHTIKMVFAKHQDEAERLLTQKRKPRPLGEDA